MPKVSIVIPAYNAETFIEETMDHAFKQTLTDFEIIVVDDGSSDRTKQVIEKYTDKVKYIYQKNQGTSAARNNGIDHAQGKYIAFLDSDDIWFPLKLERQINFLESNPKIDLVGCDAELINESGESFNKLYSRGKKYDVPPDEMLAQLLKRDFIPFSSVVVKKSLVRNLGGFDLSMVCEDYEFLMRAVQKYNIAFIDEVLMQYRISPNNKSQNLENHHRDIIKIMNKFVNAENLNLAINKKFSSSHYGLGYALFEKDQFIEARKEFLRSVYYWPFLNLKKYILLMMSFWPAGLINKCRNMKRKMMI